MRSVLKWLLIIIVIGVGANTFKSLYRKQVEYNRSPDYKPNVVDGIIGRTALDQYQNIKEKSDTFNIPAFKTGLVMFYTQHGRFPRDIGELEKSGEMNRDLTRDRFGIPYDLKVIRNTVILNSAGKDRIRGTTDDIQYEIKM